MCQIKLLIKSENKVINEKVVEIPNKDFNISNKPYFLILSQYSGVNSYVFKYLDSEAFVSVSDDDSIFKIYIGQETGRIYTFNIFTIGNNRITNYQWENAIALIKKKLCFENEKSKTFELGLYLIKHIYYSDLAGS